jgi:serine/threonine protein kinase
MPDLTGRDIGRYHIVERLGDGGMATVYKAFDNRLERYIAIKVIRTDMFAAGALLQVHQRFEREAKVLAGLAHPHIVKIYDDGEFEGLPYLIMEYLPGGTMKRWTGKPISYVEAARKLAPIARALEYAHQKGVLHRDIKPGNILIDQSGQPMLTDFGIAKILDTSESTGLTATGVGIGTPEYMAPEQGMGNQVDARSDIYALGVVFYELVTGRKPYSADTPMAVVLKHITEPLPRARQFVPDLPDEVEAVLFKALAKKPEERFSDMGAFANAIETLGYGKVPTFEPVKAQSKDERTVFQYSRKTISTSQPALNQRILIWIGLAMVLTVAIVMTGGIILNRFLTGTIIDAAVIPSLPIAVLQMPTLTPVTTMVGVPEEVNTESTEIPKPIAVQPSTTATLLPSPTQTEAPGNKPRIFNFSACLEEPCNEKNRNYAFPEATKTIFLHWEYENILQESDYVRSWKKGNIEWVRYECKWPGLDGSSVNISLREPGGLASGIWSVTITVNGIELLSEQIKIEGDWTYWAPAGIFKTCY